MVRPIFHWLLVLCVPLGELRNVFFKWSHYSENFDIPAYPGDGLHPLLRKAIQAFGADRIMWASDWSVNLLGETWAELLYSVLGDNDLSIEELELIIGGTAKQFLEWE